MNPFDFVVARSEHMRQPFGSSTRARENQHSVKTFAFFFK
jgi:hypothetical protein